MRKVYLDELPHKRGLGTSKNKCNIDWNGSVGHKCLFFYDDIEGELEILEYNSKTQRMLIKIEGYCESFDIAMANFKNCGFGVPLKKKSMGYRFEIGYKLKDEKRDFVLIDRVTKERERGKYIENVKMYKYKCNKCGYDNYWIDENSLLRDRGCPVCCVPSKLIVEGINDIPTTDNWMVKYFQGGYDEARLYSNCSAVKINMICPHCKRVSKNKIAISNLYTKNGFGCHCSDGKSYPEKFIFNMLEQLNCKFETEKSNFDWLESNIRYDFYIEHYKCIIETHGEQHYRYTGRGRSLKEEQENDNFKKEKAINNGIVNYIVLDCRNSNLEWVKKSIIDSNLQSLLDFKDGDVDWLKCHEFALGNLIKDVCYYKRENMEATTTEIGCFFKLQKGTIARYLKKGSKLGWCEYNPKEEMIRVCKLNGKNGKKVEMFKDGNKIGEYKSIKELCDVFNEKNKEKLEPSLVSYVCTGKRKHHKGYTFKYLE